MSSCQATGKSSSSNITTLDPTSINGNESMSPGSARANGGDMDHPSAAEGSPEVLGSVVQHHELENGEKNSFIQLRTSARVSKKMRLDFIASQAPPDKKDVPKEEDKMEIKPKRRPFELWPLEDKNTFFEALNEYGKDFDAIQRFFEAKAKRKNLPEHTVKNKEQIRHFYYRTWHKISKHLQFPDEVKKATQELYGLINFGELRKKIGGVSEKNSLKLTELIYKGFTQIRVRGKTIRIKTPICRALRKLNQQEELNEDIKLPARVTVQLRPLNNQAWARVQATAQNPRVQTLLPLQRRLTVLLSYLERRWQPNDVRHCEKLQCELNEVSASIDAVTPQETGNSLTISPNNDKPLEKMDSSTGHNNKTKMMTSSLGRSVSNQVLRVAPKSDVPISTITVNLSEYFTSTRLSLKSHEGRLGNHAAEELFNSIVLAGNKGCGRRGAKRLRHDSGSEKKKEQIAPLLQQTQQQPIIVDSSPDKSKDSVSGANILNNNEDQKQSCPFRLFGSGVCLDANNSSADSEPKSNGYSSTHTSLIVAKEGSDIPLNGIVPTQRVQDPKPSGSKIANSMPGSSTNSNEDNIKRIRAGWTLDNAKAVTIGELYLMFGADSKLQLEYWWEDRSMDVKPDAVRPEAGGTANSQPLALTLQKLLDIAKMYNTKSKAVECPCGHVCNGTPKSAGSKQKASRPVRINADSDKAPNLENCAQQNNSVANTITVAPLNLNQGIFRRPIMPSPQFKPPPRPGTVDAFKAQLEKFRPRFCNRRGRPISVRKNVVVPRMLPLLPKAPTTSSLLSLQVIPQRSQITGEFVPITQCPSVLNYTPGPSSASQSVSRQLQRKSIESVAPVSTSTNNTSTSKPTVSVNLSTSVQNDSMPDLCQEDVLQSKVELLPKVELLSPAPSVADDEKQYGQARPSRLVQDPFPPTLDTPVNSPPSISNLLDMSLPSELNLNSNSLLETNFSGLLSSSSGVPSSPPPASPSSILKEDVNQWLNSEVSDFSLSSFLGHLESPIKTSVSQAENTDQHSITSDVETQMQCLMAENSLDYMVKFADLAAQMASDGANKSQ